MDSSGGPVARRAGRLALWLAVATVTAAALPAGAQAFSTVTMFSEPGDYIGGGQERIYHPANGTVSISGTAADVHVGVSGGNLGDSFGLHIAAPPGQKLEAGKVYVGAQRASFREAGRPGIDVSGDGRGCNTVSGSFEVLDLATDSSGKVVRLGLVYEQHCEGGRAALFGEIRYGYGAPSAAAAVPTHVRWPATEPGAASTVQPVTLLAWNSPVTVTGSSLAGVDAEHFSVLSDECTGSTLEPGESCQVWVAFDPAQPGTRRAALHLSREGGPVTEVKLDGHGAGGRTRLVMESDPGDWIGGGQDATYTPANASFSLSGSRRFASISVDPDAGGWWDVQFEPAAGDILAPGRTYYNATRYPFNNDGNGMSFSGSGRGCNTLTGEFTVNEAGFSPEGAMRTLSISYEQHCEGGDPALRGVVEIRAGDTTPPAPWMQPVQPGTWTPPPDHDAAPGAPPYDSLTQPTRGTPTGLSKRKATLSLSPADKAQCGTSRVRGARVRMGTSRADRMGATRRKDLLVLGAGNDRAWGRAGRDCISGGPGRDRLDGGPGADVVLGGSGRDTLIGGGGRDLLVCGSGRDVAYAGKGDRTRGCERVLRR